MDEVPGVAAQLVLHPVDKIGRAIQTDRFVPPQQQTQQAIELSEVIHVGMADKGVADPHQLSSWQSADVAHVEQQGAART
jgi:hypothetical protein